MSSEQVTALIEGDDQAIHSFFGLSYSTYLVLHRSLLQSMPGEWQSRFVALLEQMREAFRHVEQTECYDLIPGTEALVNELTPGQMKRLGITSSVDDLTDEEHETFDGEITYYSEREGREMEGYERVVLPGAELIPPYSRGRTRIEPDMEAYRRAVEETGFAALVQEASGDL